MLAAMGFSSTLRTGAAGGWAGSIGDTLGILGGGTSLVVSLLALGANPGGGDSFGLAIGVSVLILLVGLSSGSKIDWSVRKALVWVSVSGGRGDALEGLLMAWRMSWRPAWMVSMLDDAGKGTVVGNHEMVWLIRRWRVLGIQIW